MESGEVKLPRSVTYTLGKKKNIKADSAEQLFIEHQMCKTARIVYIIQAYTDITRFQTSMKTMKTFKRHNEQ